MRNLHLAFLLFAFAEFSASPIEADPIDASALEAAIANKDSSQLSELVLPDGTELSAEQRQSTKLYVLEQLAILPVDARSERSDLAKILIKILPEDPTSKAVYEKEAGETNTTPLPESAPSISPEITSALTAQDGQALVSLVLKDGFDPASLGPKLDETVNTILAFARPLPATDAKANHSAYRALSILKPENEEYAEKAKLYSKAEIEQRSAILKKMKRQEDEFNGMVFYGHPNVPRYTDTRSYITTYVGTKSGRVWMRFVVHYTADSWLFIKSASFNVDGDIINLDSRDWKRDNDSEIWEWTDVDVGPKERDLIEKIIKSKKTIVRFEGQQYYDDVTVSDSDKEAMREMFLVESALIESSTAD